jgi:hypothetical protein
MATSFGGRKNLLFNLWVRSRELVPQLGSRSNRKRIHWDAFYDQFSQIELCTGIVNIDANDIAIRGIVDDNSVTREGYNIMQFCRCGM